MNTTLPVEFSLRHLIVKVGAVFAGFLYVYLGRFATEHGTPLIFWIAFGIYVLANLAVYKFMGGTPEKDERQFLIACLLDLLASTFLFFLHADMMIVMLVYLSMISGFYNFVLPRSSGVLVGVLCLTLFVFAVVLNILVGEATHQVDNIQSVGTLILGVGVLGAMQMLIRRVRRRVDSIYQVAEDLAMDLSTHAMEAAISVEDLVERNHEIKTLLKIQQDIASELEWDELFNDIVTAFRTRFTYDKLCLYLFDSQNGKLKLQSESGAEKATGVAHEVEPGQGVVGWAFTEGQGVLIDDVRKDERYIRFNERGRRIRSLACQPLTFRGERQGVMCLDSEKIGSFDENAFKFLQSTAPLISIAIHNSMHFATVKQESYTDNLTGLSNHRGFMAQFLPLLETSYTDEVPLALLMIDIDKFKLINDTYGHLVGNIILTDLSGILKGFFRGSDLVARYGGEEFVVVLRGTPADIAPRIAEQLRTKVESHQFPISLKRDTFKQVTISIGLATTNDTNINPEIASGSRAGQEDVYLRNVESIAAQIIDNADQALYAAKREGRNQVMLSLSFPVDQDNTDVLDFPESAN